MGDRLSAGSLICGPLQVLVTRWSYLWGAFLRNLTVGVLNSPSENLANVLKDFHD